MAIFRVGSAELGQRADVFVAAKHPEFSRSSLENLFDKNMVTMDGKVIKASHKLKLNDQIRVDETLLRQAPEAIELPIIYEDDSVVVIDKPTGALTHSKGALNSEATVASFLHGKITDDKLTGNRAGIVHRLDRPTSGVIIGAKTEDALKYLQKQFANRKTAKTYIAVVEGTPKQPEAIIDAPIGRNPKRPQTFRVDKEGKPAQTRYKVIKSIDKKNRSYTELELKPVTGRTHQLRIHLTYLGHPIVGDHVYGHDDGPMLLHAKSLEITLPGGQRKVFEAPLPARFKEFWAK